MELAPGLRLSPGERTVYEITGLAGTAADSAFYRARKILWNYRERDRSLPEADPDEWLRVLVRAPLFGDPETVRRGLDFELDRVLNRPDLPGLPEPLDVLDGPDAVPLLVLADPHGAALASALDCAPRTHLLRLARELLDLLAALDPLGVAADLDPASIRLDADGRWTLLGPFRPAGRSGPSAHLRAWAALARPIASRCGPPDALAGPDRGAADWLHGRLRRLTESPPASAADLLRPPALWHRLRRALSGRRSLSLLWRHPWRYN